MSDSVARGVYICSFEKGSIRVAGREIEGHTERTREVGFQRYLERFHVGHEGFDFFPVRSDDIFEGSAYGASGFQRLAESALYALVDLRRSVSHERAEAARSRTLVESLASLQQRHAEVAR